MKLLKYNSIFLVLLILAVKFISCRDKEDDLVQISSTGLNTMGWNMGKNFNVEGCKDFRCLLGCYGVTSNYRYGQLTVRGYHNDNVRIYLIAEIDSTYQMGDTIFLGGINDKYYYAGVEVFSGAKGFFGTDSLHTGYLILTSLSENKSSGTFQFECISPHTLTTKSIKNGRFDINCE